MTKKIKIERPEDLREGMRVEVEFTSELYNADVDWLVYKDDHNPLNKQLRATYEGNACYPQIELVTEAGNFNNKVKSIHRLIDGIEDVVVGDILIRNDVFCRVLDVRMNLIDRSYFQNDLSSTKLNYHYNIISLEEAKEDGFYIYIPEEEQKTELTEAEAKEIIAEVKGVEPEDIVIKKDE